MLHPAMFLATCLATCPSEDEVKVEGVFLLADRTKHCETSCKRGVKVRLHDATKLMRYATCHKIALCKRAYLCDMRLLHAVAGKLKSSNFLATIACRNKPIYIVRF